MSQQQLAKSAKISQTALSQIENGRRPGAETMAQISKVLKTPETLIHLMTMERKEVPPAKCLLYDKLFPVIESLILQIAGED